MTKTLTEQMNDGELEQGWHYTRTGKDDVIINYFSTVNGENKFYWSRPDRVLGKVPSYEQYKAQEDRIKELEEDIDTSEKVLNYRADKIYELDKLLDKQQSTIDRLKKALEKVKQALYGLKDVMPEAHIFVGYHVNKINQALEENK